MLEAERGAGGCALIGPNCLGVMRAPATRTSTPPSPPQIALPGTVGFLSQSGGPLHRHPRLSLRVNASASAALRLGGLDAFDVGWGDLIDYLGDDPNTKCIVVYMESIGDARSFLSASARGARPSPSS